MKHFRQQGYDSAFKALQEQTNVILEDPMMSELHSALVVQGDFQKAENFIEKAINGKCNNTAATHKKRMRSLIFFSLS